MSNLHLCIITGQPLANYIPLLQEQPDIIFLLHSDNNKNSAEQFVRSLEKAGFNLAQIKTKGGLPTSSYDQTRIYAMEVDEEIRNQFPDATLTWNATGGTKLMALAFWDVLDHKKYRVIYAETQHGIVEQLLPEPATIPLKSLLTPTSYLDAVGKIKRKSESDNSQWQKQTQSRKAATFHLVNHIKDLQGLIQAFNRQLESGIQKLQSLRLDNVGKHWQAALEKLEETGVLDKADNNLWHCTRTDSAKYLTGGWLEEYIWFVAKNEGVEHVETGLKFGDMANRKQGEDNEIDAFIIHHNRLLVVECKTGHMGKDAQKDSGIVYKIDSIGKQAGGIQATRLLASAQPLEHTTRDNRNVNTRARADATDIKTIEVDELKTLGKKIRHWKDNGQWPQ